MTSEERAKQFLDKETPSVYALEFLTFLFEQHAAEQREISKEACLLTIKCAKAMQAQDCAEDARKHIAWWLENQHQPLNIVSACLNATGDAEE